MCGIIGYVGENDAREVIIDGLKRLEYRGYDSSGYALLKDGVIEVVKDSVRVGALEHHYFSTQDAHIGIGHTRWATHGPAIQKNAHPHISFDSKIAIVHNGIIENFEQLKKEVQTAGVELKSDTDSELIAHLIALNYRENSLKKAVLAAADKLQGAFSILAVDAADPSHIVAYRKNASLLVGLGDGENFVASDVLAVNSRTQQVIVLEDDDLAEVSASECKVYRFGKIIEKQVVTVEAGEKPLLKGQTFMQKEIEEIPFSVMRTAASLASPEGLPKLLKIWPEHFDSVYLSGCGTAFHACLYGKYIIEKLANIPCEAVVASELRCNTLFFSPKKLAVFISQSGETSDTLAALKIAKAMGSFTLAVTNVRGSSITYLADFTLHLDCGPEIAVAATKSYNSQMLALYMLAVECARWRGIMSGSYRDFLLADIKKMAVDLRKAVCDDSIERLAYGFSEQSLNFFFIGRGVDCVTAREGALKFKEITYKMTDAYPSGELKHGTIALIDGTSMVVSVLTNKNEFYKSNIAAEQLKARGARVLLVTTLADALGDATIYVPCECSEMLMPIVTVVPLQKLALTVASRLGLDVDKPRNLAKCVTVD